MSAQPAEERAPEPARPPDLSVPELSVLAETLRQALATATRERVLSCITSTLAVDVEISRDPGLHGDVAHGKVQKISVSMPAELADLVRARSGAGGFSRYVTEAVQEQVRLDLLADLSAELVSEYGPVDEDLVNEAMREWPDFQE
jgi:hypothetical protein